MALERKKISDIPSDAVILSEDEAVSYQIRLLNNWNIKSDVLPYKYGSIVLGSVSMLVGIYINNYFRMKFKLLHYGMVSSYLPVCALPASLSFLFHQEFVIKNLVLLKQEECPVCIEMRASAIQTTIGAVLPLALAPVSSMLLVHRYGTYNIPSLIREPLKLLGVVRKRVKPIQNILFGIVIGQALLGGVVTYLEANSIYKVHSKLLKLEDELERAGKI